MVAGLALAGCPEGKDADKSSAKETTQETNEPKATPSDTPVAQPPSSSQRHTHLDLVALAHLADFDHQGLRIRFGTTARLKYTNGNWNSGFASDGRDQSVAYSQFGKMGRIYFPVEQPTALRLRMRVKPIGATRLMAFLNGNELEGAAVAPGEGDDGFRTVDIAAPEASIRKGENYLLLRGDATRKVGRDDVSFAISAMHIAPEGASKSDELAPELVSEVKQGRENRQGIRLPEASQASFHFEVPSNAKLTFRVSPATETSNQLTAKVRVDPSVGAAAELFSQLVTDGGGLSQVSLAPFAGRVVRLSLVVEPRSKMGARRDAAIWSDVRVEVPPHKARPPEAPAKNVIVLVIDTLRADKLKPYRRQTRVRTPALNEVARAGVVFENAQSPENWTKPACASMLTSLHPSTHQTQGDRSKLPESVLTLGEVYQKAGFQTASFIANGYVSDAFGFKQGWHHYTNYIRERKNTNASNVFGEAATWIEQHKDERFFAYIQTIDPHVPYDPPDKFLKLYDDRDDYDGQIKNRRTHLLLEDAKRNPPKVVFTESDKKRLEALYDGEISYHDSEFKKFLAKLESLGLADNTIIVVTSDHGEELEDHGSWGHGHSVYQELLHVPLIVRWPKGIAEGQRVTDVVSTMHIGPTVLEATGVDVPAEFEGRSLMGHVTGQPPRGPFVAFSEFQDNRRVIRAGDYKLIIRANLTYTMFDLGQDPKEQTELDGRKNSIAMRYLRVLSGQFLGATDRGRWLLGGGTKKSHQAKEEMDSTLCRQLVALGYMDCLEQFPDSD